MAHTTTMHTATTQSTTIQSTVPVLIDTDPGIDDLLAIWAAWGCPELDVRALTAVHGNVPLELTWRNVQRLTRQIADTTDRPLPLLGCGATCPWVSATCLHVPEIHGQDGLGNIAEHLPHEQSPNVAPPGALEVQVEVLENSTAPVTIIALGPLTNLATLLAARPDLRSRIARIVMMGGGDGVGNTSPAAEFNIAADPEAAERVFTDEVPVTMVGLDLTHAVRFGRPWLMQLADGGRCGQLAAEACERYIGRREERGIDWMALHDAVAVAATARPELLDLRPVDVHIDHEHGPGRGATFLFSRTEQVPTPGRAPVAHAHKARTEAIIDWVAESITRLDAPRT